MNEHKFSNPYSKIYGEDRNSWPPKAFLAELLHELRNPIYVIKGWTEFLSQEQTKEHIPEALKSISHSIEKLEDVYQGIADYYQELQSKS